MTLNWKRWAALGLTLGGFAAAWAGIKRSESGLHRHLLNVPGDKAGDHPVPVLAFEPEEAKPGSPAMLLAHGFASSKEIMQVLGSQIARQGIRTFLLDMPGHGSSTTPSVLPVMDFSNVVKLNVKQLAQVYNYVRQKYPRARIGVLGHSMGSGAILNFAAEQPNLATAIPISVAGNQPADPKNPRNMLLLVGERDVPICISSARDMYRKATGKEAGQTESETGSLKNGTARRFKVMPKLDHISILFAPPTIREVDKWLEGVFGLPAPDGKATGDRLYATGLGVLSAYASYFPFSRLLADTFKEKPLQGVTYPGPKRKLAAALLLTLSPIGSVLLLNRVKLPPLTRLQLGDYLMSFFGISGMLALAQLKLGRLGNTLDKNQKSGLSDGMVRRVILPAIEWGYVYSTMGGFSSRSWTSFRLTPARLRAMSIVAPGIFPYFLASELTFRRMKGATGVLLSSASKLSLMAALVLAVKLKPELSFLLILFAPMLLAFLLFEICAIWRFRKSQDPVAGAVFQTLVFAWIISALFPLLGE
jgi:pimeloyl-ACP methyl ester carboxylesterase